MPKKSKAVKIEVRWETHLPPRYWDGEKLESDHITKIKRYLGRGFKKEFDTPVTVPIVERLKVDMMSATIILREDPQHSAQKISNIVKDVVKDSLAEMVREEGPKGNLELLNFAIHHDEDTFDGFEYAEIWVDPIEYIPEYYGQQRLFAKLSSNEKAGLKQSLISLGEEAPELRDDIRPILDKITK